MYQAKTRSLRSHRTRALQLLYLLNNILPRAARFPRFRHLSQTCDLTHDGTYDVQCACAHPVWSTLAFGVSYFSCGRAKKSVRRACGQLKRMKAVGLEIFQEEQAGKLGILWHDEINLGFYTPLKLEHVDAR